MVYAMSTKLVGLMCAVIAVSGVVAFGLPFEVPVDPAQSTLTVELCVSGTCDADWSDVTGRFVIELDSVDQPTEITLYDFDLEITDDLDLSLSWGFLGGLDATATAVAVMYADPGTPVGPVQVSGDTFLLASTPSNTEGMLSYTATGIPCLALQNAGLPCSDARDLAEDGTDGTDFAGDVQGQDRIVTLVATIDSTRPLDDENPGLGELHVYGTVRGAALVPQPLGDIDGDGDVDLGDHGRFAECAGGPDVLIPPATCSQYHFDNSDLDGDGDVDLADFGLFGPLVE